MHLLRFTLAVLLLFVSLTPTCGFAQGILPTDWPTPYRDACNTSSTPVLPPSGLKPMFEIPTEAQSTDAAGAPRVYLRSDGQHVLIMGGTVYDAWTGHFKAVLRHDGYHTAVTTVGSDDVVLTGNGSQFTAYNLVTSKELWNIDVTTTGPPIGRVWAPTARDGVFYLAGEDQLAAVDAREGTKKWSVAASFDDWTAPPIARINGEDLVFPHGAAVEAASGQLKWQDIFVGRESRCIDEDAGLLFGSTYTDGSRYLTAVNALTGASVWNSLIDHILNGPPTLGWARDEQGQLQPAVFALTGGNDGAAGVYAFEQITGGLLWSTTIPHDAWRTIVYCGKTELSDSRPGKLYISTGPTLEQDTYVYVLDAFTGQQLEVMTTNNHESGDNPSPVIVDVKNPDDDDPGNFTFEPVMYVLTGSPDFSLVAWSASGESPPPQNFNVQVEAPDQLPIASSAQAVAHVSVDTGESLERMKVDFACDAGRNEGYLEPSSALVDANGQATVTFHSQNKTATVKITATLPNGASGETIVMVTKGGDEPPPTNYGSIQGVVTSSNGKAARKVTVLLCDYETFDPASPTVIATTATNPQGRYTFENLQELQPYTVFVDTGDGRGWTDVFLSNENPNVTNANVSLSPLQP